ncbi:MAG: hypothetical protein ACOVQM_21760, partial [Pirellula sp.]
VKSNPTDNKQIVINKTNAQQVSIHAWSPLVPGATGGATAVAGAAAVPASAAICASATAGSGAVVGAASWATKPEHNIANKKKE